AVKAAPTFSVTDPDVVAARRSWWKAGRPGHYPGCPCVRCTSRITATEPEPIPRLQPAPRRTLPAAPVSDQPDGIRTVAQSITDVPLPTARGAAAPDVEPF